MAEEKSQIAPAKTTKLSQAIKVANELVTPMMLPDNSCYALDPLLRARLKKYILEPDEELLFFAKQSKLYKLVPNLFVFTDKKIVIGKPSILHVFGIKSLAIRETDLIKYTEIRDLSLKRGMYLRSVSMKIAGSEFEIKGMTLENADLILKFLMRILEYLES